MRGEAMPVGYKYVAVKIFLQVQKIAGSSKIIAEVQLACGPDAGKDAFFAQNCGFKRAANIRVGVMNQGYQRLLSRDSYSGYSRQSAVPLTQPGILLFLTV